MHSLIILWAGGLNKAAIPLLITFLLITLLKFESEHYTRAVFLRSVVLRPQGDLPKPSQESVKSNLFASLC